jgi:hypothetical protein
MARRQQEGLHEVHETITGGNGQPSTEGGGGGAYDAAGEESERLGYNGSDGAALGYEGETNGKKPKKTTEEKRADFTRLAERRVSTALDAIESLIHLCTPQSYAWTPEARALIFDTLRQKLTNVERCFVAVEQSGGKKTVRPLSFRLPV